MTMMICTIPFEPSWITVCTVWLISLAMVLKIERGHKVNELFLEPVQISYSAGVDPNNGQDTHPIREMILSQKTQL